MSNSRKKINRNESQIIRKQTGFCYHLLIYFDTEFFPDNERSFTRTLRFKCYYGLDVSMHCDKLVAPFQVEKTFYDRLDDSNLSFDDALNSTSDVIFLDRFFSLLVKKGFAIYSI